MAEKQEQATTEETPKQEVATKPEDTTQQVEGKTQEKVADDTDVIDAKTTENAEGYKPLFGEEEEFSEADLTGIDDEKPPEGKEEDKESSKQAAEKKPEKEKEAAKTPEEIAKEEAEAKAQEEQKAKEEAKSKDKKEAEEKAAKEKAETKPPEGYVPHAALHETRELLKEEKAARKALEARVEQLVAEKESPPEEKPILEPDFKILDDLELEELIEDDPQEAIRYQNRLMAYNTKKATAEKAMNDRQREAEAIVYNTVERIEKAVPGIYDDDSPVAKDLADFAVKSGFKDEGFLEIMTNPSTVVTPPGTNKRILLGDGAASLIEMLNNVHKLSAEGNGNVDVEKIRGEIREEVTKEVTEKVTKELLKKLNPEHVPAEFRSIEELPGSQETPVASKKQYTEAEFARLSEEEQERLLGG